MSAVRILPSAPEAPRAVVQYIGPDPEVVAALGMKPLAKVLTALRDAVAAEQQAERLYLAALAPEGADFTDAVAEDAAAILAGNESAGAAEAVLADQGRRLADWHVASLVARYREADVIAAASEAAPDLAVLRSDRLKALDEFITGMIEHDSRTAEGRMEVARQDMEADRLRQEFWLAHSAAKWAADPSRGYLDEHGPKQPDAPSAWPLAAMSATARSRIESDLGIRRIAPVGV